MRSTIILSAAALCASVALAQPQLHHQGIQNSARLAAHKKHVQKTQQINLTNPEWVSKTQKVNDTDPEFVSKKTSSKVKSGKQMNAQPDISDVKIGVYKQQEDASINNIKYSMKTQQVDETDKASVIKTQQVDDVNQEPVIKTQVVPPQKDLVNKDLEKRELQDRHVHGRKHKHTGHKHGMWAAKQAKAKAAAQAKAKAAAAQKQASLREASDDSNNSSDNSDSEAGDDSDQVTGTDVISNSKDAWGAASVGVVNFSPKQVWPVQSIYNTAKKAISSGNGVVKTYSTGSGSRSAIQNQWYNNGNGAYFFMADMDVDCDGQDYRCKGNPDGQDRTTFGALAAYEVPFIVIPDDFYMAHQKDIPQNAMAAVICDGKMFYGILGDTNGDTPRVTGEASWLMARTCFPDENLNGARGHGKADVLYIQFLGDDAEMKGVGSRINNMGSLQSKGDLLMGRLTKSMGLA